MFPARAVQHRAATPAPAQRWLAWSGYVYVLPALILYAIFVLRPVLGTVILSLQRWDGAQAERPFVGLANYQRLVNDPIFLLSFRNNLVWIITSVLFPMTTGLLLAVVLSGVR
ncbi:MAG: sugar ABC transporter permease, partial [Deinococcus sp.]|nr:sugar ABC transporter permease [Deinococcus sp.]